MLPTLPTTVVVQPAAAARRTATLLLCYRLHASKSMRGAAHCCDDGRDSSMHIAAAGGSTANGRWQQQKQWRQHPGCAFQTRLDVCKDCLCFEIIERRGRRRSCFRKRTKKRPKRELVVFSDTTAHNELKRGKKSIFAGQCAVRLKGLN